MCRVRTRSKRKASSQNLTRKTSHMLNIPYNFLNGFELISKMTCGPSKSAEIRRSAEKSHVWYIHLIHVEHSTETADASLQLTSDQRGRQTQLPQLWFQAMAEVHFHWSRFQHHRLCGNVAWPCIVFHFVAVKKPVKQNMHVTVRHKSVSIEISNQQSFRMLLCVCVCV